MKEKKYLINRNILFLVTVIILCILAISFLCVSSKMKQKYNAVKTTQKPTVTVTASSITMTTDPTASLEREDKDLSVQIKIHGLPDQTLELMGISKEELSEEIKRFANASGFCTIKDVYYYGTTTINHEEDTVSAVFCMDAESIYTFSIEYQKKNKKFREEIW